MSNLIELYNRLYENKTENENEMKSRSHRYDMKRPRISHVHKHTKYKMCQGRMMVVCIKQNLRNISSSIHLNVKRD